jgi:N-acetylglucosamine kinase-like BadF-type ATPase
MDYVLGVDGGATKTLIWVTDANGKKITEIISGPTNYRDIGIESSIMNINSGILKAIDKINLKRGTFKSTCFGLAGFDDEADFKIFKKIVFNKRINKFLDFKKTILCNDAKIALFAGSNNKNRIIIICGTGISCYGINENGLEAKTTGWDYILGDEGSGYTIGLEGLKVCMRAFDGRGGKTLLSKIILDKLKLKDEIALSRWVYKEPFSKKKIASIAKLVEKAAEQGDKKCIRIYEDNAKELVLSVSTVVKKLDLRNKYFDLVLSGSLFKCKKYFTNIIVEMLSEQFSNIKFIQLEKNPVEGAIKLAIENL